MSDKLTKVQALYFPTALIDPGPNGVGAACFKCRDFIALTNECVILDPPPVSAARGICSLYVHGNPRAHGPTLRLVPAPIAGYEQGQTVPTYCGRCKYYGGVRREEQCALVEGMVEYGGCCGLYEATRTR